MGLCSGVFMPEKKKHAFDLHLIPQVIGFLQQVIGLIKESRIYIPHINQTRWTNVNTLKNVANSTAFQQRFTKWELSLSQPRTLRNHHLLILLSIRKKKNLNELH